MDRQEGSDDSIKSMPGLYLDNQYTIIVFASDVFKHYKSNRSVISLSKLKTYPAEAVTAAAEQLSLWLAGGLLLSPQELLLPC